MAILSLCLVSVHEKRNPIRDGRWQIRDRWLVADFPPLWGTWAGVEAQRWHVCEPCSEELRRREVLAERQPLVTPALRSLSFAAHSLARGP